jgi:hypothetical protein
VKKRTLKDIMMKAAPDLFGNKEIETEKNYVIFGVPAAVYNKVREWLDIGDGERLTIGTVNQPRELRLIIINEREQELYRLRGYKSN